MLKRVNAVKLICFICILGILLASFHRIFSFKYVDGIYPLKTFYEEKDDSIDVMFFGSSHVFENVNTGVLWSEYGIAGFDLCGSVQPIWNTYYYIKEALKTQHPKVLVVDVYGAIQTKDYIDHSRVIKNNYGLKFSLDKINSIKESAPEDEWINYLLEYPTYHSRYQEINESDFLKYRGTANLDCWKGFGMNVETKSMTKPEDISEIKEVGTLTEKVEKYLVKIIKLAKENNIPLQLIVTPYILSEEEQKIYNCVEEISKENNVPFNNFNLQYDEIGIDFNSDFADKDHMNHRGNVKFTRYLADYLKENYDIPDRRENEEYKSWNVMAEDCSQKIYNQELKEIQDIGNWLNKAWNENYLLVYTIAGDYKNIENYNEVKNKLQQFGISLDNAGKSGAWVFEGNELLWTSIDNDETIWHMDIGENDRLMVQLLESEGEESTMPVVNFNNTQYQKVEQGLNVFVYDTLTEEFVENVGFVISGKRLQYVKQQEMDG